MKFGIQSIARSAWSGKKRNREEEKVSEVRWSIVIDEDEMR